MFSVTLTKSVRTSKGKIGPVSSLCSEIKAVQVLELDRRRRKELGGQFNAVKLLARPQLRHRAGAQVFRARP